MKLSQNGSQSFFAYEAWREYCLENNIVDPWQLEREIENEYKHSYTTVNDHGNTEWHINYDEPTEEQKQRLKECHKYRNQYIQDREIWVGKYILKNFGYNALTFFAQAQTRKESAFQDWFAQIEPCEGNEQQCNMFCLKFTECPYRGEA